MASEIPMYARIRGVRIEQFINLLYSSADNKGLVPDLKKSS
jgi:hypothetical protein